MQVVQLYKQKALEWRHKIFMWSAIYTFCKRLKLKQYYEVKIVVKHAAEAFWWIFEDIWNKQMAFQIKRCILPNAKLKTIRDYSENVSLCNG